MSNLLQAVDSNGKIIGRCNARCYLGTGEHCRCICGGKNHGQGLLKAAQQSIKIREIDPSGLDYPVRLDHLKLVHHPKLSRYAHPQLFPTE